MPIKVTSRFATVRDTAHVLGVSKRRTNQLIEIVERSLKHPTSAHRTSQASSGRSAARASIKRKASSGSPTHTSRPNGSTKRAKTAKAKR